MADSNNKFNFRRDTLHRTFQESAQAATNSVRRRYRNVAPIEFLGDSHFEEMNLFYWGLVAWFKTTNDFNAAHRINEPKKAALTIYAAMAYRELIFNVDDSWKANNFEHFFFARLAIEVMQVFMGRIRTSIDPQHFDASTPTQYELTIEDQRNLVTLLSRVPLIEQAQAETRYVEDRLAHSLCTTIESLQRRSATGPAQSRTRRSSVDDPMTEDFDFHARVPRVVAFTLSAPEP